MDIPWAPRRPVEPTPATGTHGEAIAAWTAHYEADTAKALERVAQLRQHRIPGGHHAELLGASLALTPPENRCVHWGDRTNCAQCLTDPEER
jgi:hypothetical protein